MTKNRYFVVKKGSYPVAKIVSSGRFNEPNWLSENKNLKVIEVSEFKMKNTKVNPSVLNPREKNEVPNVERKRGFFERLKERLRIVRKKVA